MHRYLIFLLFISANVFSQEDTLTYRNEKGSFFDVAWVPVGMGIISIDLMRDSGKFGLQRIARSFVADTFRTHVDDWIQYAPTAMMYTADLFKVPARNTVWNQTKYLIISQAVTSGLVWGLKFGLGIQRPGNGSYTAYPSGHTAQAFVESQVLYNEFRNTAPVLAYSGHAIATSVAALRVLNNRHWVPDVILGAGLAILVTNAVYYFEPLKNWNPWKKKDRKSEMFFTPSFGGTDGGFWGGNLRLKF